LIRGIIIAVLSVAVVGTAFWGYQEHKEKNAILVNAENNYQRAFHDLTYNIDLLHDKIGTTLAMNSRSSISPALAEVWRITSEARSSVGQLPLTLLPFNKTEEFLAEIGEFSYRTAVRDLDKEPLTEEEYQSLQTLYNQAAEIQDELRKVQHLVLENHLRWMDVELALATDDENADNTIIDGFKTVEKTVEGYAESDKGIIFSGMQKRDENFKYLEGKTISKNEAIEIAKKYGRENKGDIHVEESKKGADYGFYSISYKDKNNVEVNMDITKKGGYPIWFLKNREVGKQKISLNDAANRAIKFINDNNFESMEMFESAQYDNVGVFTFVSTIDNVRIYPDAIKIKVALDDGSILGFSAEEYLSSHHVREIPKAKVSEAEARKEVNPNVKIMENRLAMIMNDLNEEVLVYEYLGVLGDDTYRIFINAISGKEEKVEKLKDAEPIYEDLV